MAYSANAKYICSFKEFPSSYYKRHKKNGNILKNFDAACFSLINIYETNWIFAIFKIQPNLIESAGNFYLDFLSKIFDKKIYRTRISKDKKKLFFFINSKNLPTTSKVLLYLTAVRYFQEFPEIINDFYQRKTGDLEKDFLLFQEIHREFVFRGAEMTYDNLGGHGLIYKYEFESKQTKHKPISLKEFKDRLVNFMGRVQEHFY